jgi:hypothetical protein
MSEPTAKNLIAAILKAWADIQYPAAGVSGEDPHQHDDYSLESHP